MRGYGSVVIHLRRCAIFTWYS